MRVLEWFSCGDANRECADSNLQAVLQSLTVRLAQSDLCAHRAPALRAQLLQLIERVLERLTLCEWWSLAHPSGAAEHLFWSLLCLDALSDSTQESTAVRCFALPQVLLHGIVVLITSVSVRC